MLLSLLRVIKFSFQDVFRNIWLSLVTIIILILALFTVNMLLVVKVIGQTAVEAVKDKIDINLFIRPEASEEQIMALKARISNLEEVRDLNYISKEQAQENFKINYQDNPEVLQALRAVGKNPFTPSLIIKPKNLDVFNNLINKLNAIEDPIIESRNFADYKVMLEKINNITDKVSEAGIALSIIFIFITVLVIFNSVRVAIYTHRTEIKIMSLVGASNWFIQAPYLFSSVIYTAIGIGAIMMIFYPFLSLLQPYLEAFFVGYNVNLVTYFYGHIFKVFGLQFLVATLINILASYIAVKKYSQV